MIRVIYNFGGRETKEKRILPGTYQDDDPALFGLADYLVKNGHAVRLDAPSITPTFNVTVTDSNGKSETHVAPAPPAFTIESDEDDSDPLQDYTKAELLEIAEESGLELSERMTKADIIAAIEAEG